jgi:hypothetical protein
MSYALLPDTIWDWDHPLPKTYLEPLSRYQIIGYTWPKPEPIACPGEGKCHGCVSWCDYCGDVKEVCDAEWPDRCDRHQRYPTKPEPPKPDPNQLSFPGF